MELIITNENSFDPTPRLKSSLIPINFVSFNRDDFNCFYKYTQTLLYNQKYCKNCFNQFVYDLTDYDLTDNNTYLDVCIDTHRICLCRERETKMVPDVDIA
jgi:hypothetical protein